MALNVLLAALACSTCATIEGGMVIDTDFENACLVDYEIIQPDTIKVGPLNSNRHRWFAFRIRGVKHRRINFEFEWREHSNLPLVLRVKGNDTAMVTYDGKGYEIVKDVVWAPKTPGATSGGYVQRFSHVFREDEALVAYAAPWSNTTLARLADELKGDRRVQVDSIGDSRFHKLPLTYFRLTDRSVPDESKRSILIVAREDSYEVGASWAAEGMLRFLLSDAPVAREVLKQAIFHVFPLFSADGVAMGHTNFPLTEDGSEYVYVTARWNVEPPYHEVRLMKDFWQTLRAAGEDVDILLRPHATCYFQPHFRPGSYSEENAVHADRLLDLLTTRLPWRVQARRSTSTAGMNHQLVQVFPDALTFSAHDDFVFTASFLGTQDAVIRRHEDVMQDGELIVRTFAEFHGIPSKAAPPYLMAGDVNTNAVRQGDTVTFSVYYYDFNGLPATSVHLHVNDKSYAIQPSADADYRKPVRYTYDLTITEPRNDFSFTASNGRQTRTIPHDYQLPGPFLID